MGGALVLAITWTGMALEAGKEIVLVEKDLETTGLLW